MTAASASTAGVDIPPLEKKVQDNLLSTPQQDPNRTRRNPVYGDAELQPYRPAATGIIPSRASDHPVRSAGRQ